MAIFRKLTPKGQPPVEPTVSGFDVLLDRANEYVSGLPRNKRIGQLILWSVITVVLAVAASLDFGENFGFIRPIVGLPAGVLLFLIGYMVIKNTSLQELPLFHWKEETPHRKRMTPIVIGVVIGAIVLIALGGWIPAGLGGALTVAGVLTAFNLFRRTAFEIELDRKGLPDPRDNVENEEEEYLADYDEDDFNNETDYRQVR